MRYFIFIVLVFLVSCFSGASSVRAEISRISPEVIKAEQYMNGLVSAQARFVQTAQNGAQLIGTFYLNRPGRLRFEYDDPIEDFIVADGFLIYFYDAELGQQTNAPIGMTMAHFLLRPELRFDGEINVSHVQNSGELLQITLAQSDEPEAGSITLGFTENPMALKKWQIRDSMGAVTEIELFQLETNIELARNLFIYSDPKRFEEHYND